MNPNDECAHDGCSLVGVKHRNKLLGCYSCDKKFHWKCIGVNAAIDQGCRDNDGLFWFCTDCREYSAFHLHQKVDGLYSLVDSIRKQISSAEKNLESKIFTCYNMISNLNKIHTLTNEHFLSKSCCNNQNDASDVIELVRNLNECSLSAESTEHQANTIGPILADLPTPPRTQEHSRVNVSTANPGDNVTCSGNSAQIICPTEASSDTAPSSNVSQNVVDATSSVPPDFTRSNDAPVAPVFRSGKLTTGICPAEVDNGTAPPSQVFRPIPAPRHGKTSTKHPPSKSKTRKSSSTPATSRPEASVPFACAPTMPYWFLPTPSSYLQYPNYANAPVPPHIGLPLTGIPAPATVPMSSFVPPPPVVSQQIQTPALPQLSQPSTNLNPIPTLRAPPAAHSGHGQLIPAQSMSSVNEPPANYKHFYIKPFDPTTSDEHIVEYICSKTGWERSSFRCQPLASAARRERALSFVSFKVSVLDNPVYINTITSKDFWPSFVSVGPFIPRRRK